MSEVILRIRAPNGLQRLTIKKDATIGDLRNEIQKLTNIPVTDQVIRAGQKDGVLVASTNLTKKLKEGIKDLDDGYEFWVSAAKPQAVDIPVIISEDQKKKQDEEARREAQRRQFDEKQKKKEEEEKKQKEEYQKKEEERKAQEMIVESEKQPNKKKAKKEMEAKHISFDEYVEKNKGPPRPHSFRVDYNCKKHEPYPKGMCTNCIPQTAIMKRQPYRHVDYAEFMNVKEMNNYVVRWSQKHYAMQRAGILYGYYAEDPNYPQGVRAIIEAIYEPPQIEDVNSVEILEDPRQTKVDMIAEALGFERIGWIFTTLVQQKGLTSYEVRMISRLQEQHLVVHPTGYKVSKFITVVMRHDGQNVAPDVYMVSDQCQAMERDAVFDDPDTYKELKIRDPVDKHDIVPVVIAENKETKKIDPDFFVVDINHGQPKHNKFNYIKHADFPVENLEGKKQTTADIKAYLSKHSKEKAYIKYADFHFLVYLAEILDVDTASILADAVKNEFESVNESIELLLNSF